MDITPVPLAYNGVQYRSALEADWAAMFTELGIYFEYEPQPWRMPSGAVYDCDFYLPTLRTYCEAKGPHNERLWKPREFAAALAATEYPRAFQVVILRPAGPSGNAAWEPAGDGETPRLAECAGCLHWGFTDHDPLWQQAYCRRCYGTNFTRFAWSETAPDGPGISMPHAPRRAA